MTPTLFDQVAKTADFLKARLECRPKLGVILGSGLGAVADRVAKPVSIPFGEIEGFPRSAVVGHAGRLVGGTLAGKDVVVMAGRGHYYEGNPMSAVTFPVRVMRALGVETLLITNAAGGVRADLKAGSFMVMSDHLNLMGVNPLHGANEDRFGLRFPDMTEAYDKDLRRRAIELGKRLGIELAEGVYAAMSGPSYETPAEVRMLRTLGADAVGMSTVPEVIVARHGGIKVLGISFISNAAAGLGGAVLTHEEVTAEGAKARPRFEKLVLELVAVL